ncbi:hypothetical protein ACHAXA_008590 [Cyclostephanos tholiformis]|uniref:Uncharacterized protein n=1 Tax=Cyclostephanos tholiformis TaxID=382380 RepID=A0ABD3SP69_9STRA
MRRRVLLVGGGGEEDMTSDPMAADGMGPTEIIHSGSRGTSADVGGGKGAEFSPFRLRFRSRTTTNESTRRADAGRVGKRVTRRTIAITDRLNEKLDEARRKFRDRMAAASFTLIDHEHDATMSNGTFFDLDGHDDEITPQSDLLLPNRDIFIVTTAALPWRTGTAVNPLLRAAYLARRAREINDNNRTLANELTNRVDVIDNTTSVGGAPSYRQMVTLVIPWLELEEDRLELYGPDATFDSIQEQENYIRDWLRNEAKMADVADADTGLKIIFYPARYHSGLKSIFAMGDMVGDICAVLRKQIDGGNLNNSVCILEEPEHLNWYRAPGEGWTKVFNYVVGIVHTNYVEYAGSQFHGLWTAPAIQVMSSAMIRAYCHKVIKLSGVLQSYAPEKECIENVHGVREDFIYKGRRRAQHFLEKKSVPLDEEVEGRAYYIGKILWAKGFEQMLELEEFYRECTGKYFAIDVYGSGPEEDEIKRAFYGRRRGNKSIDTEETESDSEDVQSYSREFISKKLTSLKISSQEFELPKSLYELRKKPIPAKFLGPVDHALLGDRYKVFVNPSVSEVLCTTTYEALAMGNFAIIPDHESNKFFSRFPNCLCYRDKWEFAANLRWALTHEPEPLTPELAQEFTWEAATERLIRSSAITRREAKERALLGKAKLDERIAFFHRELGKGTTGDALRKFLGGGPVSNQVKYEIAKQGLDHHEGLTQKFRTSSFVRAIQSSLRLS